jgi:methylmalonyl-CoA mutase
MAKANEPTFAGAFPASDEAQWKSLVERVLKGAPFEKLVGKTYDGIAVQPLYPRASAATPIAAAHDGGWESLARIDHGDARSANEQALTDLENGASGLALVFAGSTGAYGFGLTPDADTLDHVLDNVVLETGLPIEFDAGKAGTALAGAFEKIVVARKISAADVNVHFGLDPLHENADIIAAAALRLKKADFRAASILADARRVHMAGGTEAQELALALACALASLRALEKAGASLDDARALISFRLAADADQFLTIAKFRALRRLFARIEEACGLVAKPIHIHAETAWRMMTRRDPYVNLLRTTTAAFAAGIGGADRISVLPFTQALGLPDPFARRLSRNTQAVLLDESNLGRVIDAGAGAGGIETLTDELCTAAWALFQQSEKSGLPLFLLSLSKDVAKARDARLKNIAKRKDPLTGTSEFPNVHEGKVDVLAPARPLTDDKLFPPMLLAQEFEALRDRADKMKQRPKVFLATLGSVADYTARAMFAKNFFEAGGIEAVIHESGDVAEAFAKSGAKLACLVSSDAVYAEQAVSAAKTLAPKAAKTYLAGRPNDLETALKEAGVSRFIYVGCDLIDVLNDALSKA